MAWSAKAILILVVVYVLSPIDLVPDEIPGVGFLDDVIVIPLGIMLATRLIPREILAEHRAVATRHFTKGARIWVGCLIGVLLWLAMTAWVLFAILRQVR